MKERETIDTDVLVVGGGPAGLAAAIRFKDLLDDHNRSAGSTVDASVMVVEKAADFGAHSISGAVMDPVGLAALIPDYEAKGAPVGVRVAGDHVYFLTEGRRFEIPWVPPAMNNHGLSVLSLNQLVKWMAGQAEERGIDLFAGFPGAELLCEGARVVGVRIGDKGVDKHGRPKGNFEAGVDIKAKVTVLAEGARGSLTKALVSRLRLDDDRQPMVYSLGIKELWEVPKGRLAPGTVLHTMGWPLDSATYGGGFIYGHGEERIALGLVVGLDYRDPLFDPHALFNRYKRHPLVEGLLSGGRIVRYGARTISEGGWYAVPRCHADGVLIVGEAGGYLNSMRLKGIHLAIQTGMMAAETALDAVLANDSSSRVLEGFTRRVEDSSVKAELWKVRNFHQGFRHGIWAGMLNTAVQVVTGGRGLVDPLAPSRGHAEMETLEARYGFTATAESFAKPKPDGLLTFDRVTDVFNAGTRHDEDQPVHLKVADTTLCETRCGEEYGHPCERFCPAAVYEMVPKAEGEGKRLQINFSNCVHCKTCDIMDPYQVITWVTPEGGGGPRYDDL